MKTYITLILLLICAAFSAGYYGFSFRGDYQASPKDKVDISYLKRNFVKVHTPVLLMSTRELFPTQDFKALAFSPKDSKIVRRDSFFTTKYCFDEIGNLSSKQSVKKVLFWENYRCGIENKLPGSFFKFPPFVHPSGHSYVYLFYKYKGEKEVSRPWILNHLQYLTYEELEEFEKKWNNLPPPYNLLSQIEKEVRPLVGSLTGTFFSKDYVFLLDWDIFNFFETIYKVYPKKDFVKFFSESSYSVSPVSNRKCLIKEGNLCWNYSLSHLIEKVGYSKVSISLILIGGILFGLFSIYSMFSKERKEDEKRKFALRILSHELRTPVSSILLKLENLTNNSANFSDDDQEKILKISSDAHRLRRLIEMSTNYLTSSQKENIKLRKELDSINGFLEDFSFDYPEIEITVLEEDISLKVDEYWLQVCVKNLIENAKMHGKAPIKLNCKLEEKFVKISVSDAGECSFNDLKHMTEDFVKGNNSSGTGLGLNIVQKVLKNMNAKLSFSKNPTTFSISIERGEA